MLANAGGRAFRARSEDVRDMDLYSRMYPAIVIADLPVGGLTYPDASQSLAQRAASIRPLWPPPTIRQ